MPPHLDTEPLRFYTTSTSSAWVPTDPLSRTSITADSITVNGSVPVYYDAPSIEMKKIVTNDELEHFSQKIYKIIAEHTKINISEEEFMTILKEDE